MDSSSAVVGRTLGHYRVLEEIGAGGMGVVYRARDERLERDVALKILAPGTVDASARKRLHREAVALSKANHPNIATVHDFDCQNGLDFLVMEYIPGRTIDEQLTANSLPEKEVIALGTQLVEGLSAAHEQGVVHRDLKPANLRLTIDGRLKILDFGLAKVHQTATAADKTVSLSASQALVGTLPYMAPEQLLGEEIDARTDIYAAGVVLYEMATGKRPFAGLQGPQLMAAILRQAPVPLCQITPKLSPELERIIGKCLEKEPENRFQSAKELAVDLRRLALASGTAQTPAPSRLGEKWPTDTAAVDARGRPERPHSVRKTPGMLLRIGGILALLLVAAGAALWYSNRRPTNIGGSPNVLAVLYFNNVSQDPSLDWLNGTLTEMLTTNLGQVQGFEVLSRDHIARIRRRMKLNLDGQLTADIAPDVAREAGADAFVTGALMRLGPSRLRIDVHLQDASTGRLLFSDKVDTADVNGIFATVDTITIRLAERVLSGNAVAAAPAIEEVTTSNIEALRHFQAGAEYNRRMFIVEATREYEQAVRLDPQFAEPYLKLLGCYQMLGDVDKVREALQALDPLRARLPRAERLEYESVLAGVRGDRRAALQAREALLREHPRDSENRLQLAANVGIDDPQRALGIVRQGLALDPKDHTLWNLLLYVEASAGNEAAALEACDRYQALLGDSEPNTWDSRGDILYKFGRYSEAEAAYRKEQEIDPNFGGASIKLPIIHSEQGRTVLALDELRSNNSQALADRVDIAMIEAQLPQSAGKPELAVPLYRKAILRFMRERQPALTASLFTVFATFAIAIGEEQAVFEFAQQQKLQQSEVAVALLHAALGHESAADEALARFSTANQGFPTNIDTERALKQVVLGLRRGDRGNLARALPQLGASRHIPFSFVLFVRGRAALALNDYAAAERDLLLAMRQVREIRNSVGIRRRMPVIEQLCHFYLGQVYEATNQREDAIGQYQRFLSSYTKSGSRLPQIVQARSALNRLSSSSIAPAK